MKWLFNPAVLRDAEPEAGGGDGEVSDIERLRQEVQLGNQRFNMLEASLRQAAQPVAQQPGPQQPDLTEINKHIWANPARAMENMNAQFQQQLGAAFANDQEALVTVARNSAREIDADLWERYKGEVEERMAQLPVQYHRNPNTWKIAFQNVLGAHYRDLRSDAAEKDRPARTPAIKVKDGPAAPSTRPAPTPADAELDPQALQIGKKMRLLDPEKDMRRGLQLYANQGDPDDPTKPSSWDEVITFDSRKRKAS